MSIRSPSRNSDVETEAQTLARWARHDTRMMWLERMKKFGSLYAPTHNEAMFRIIAADIEEELGFGIEEKPNSVVGIDIWESEASPGSRERCNHCHSWDVYQFSCEAGWACEDCRSPHTTIWGCLGCLKVVCDECVWRSASMGMTLEEIGKYFEVTKERIRQTEAKALRKLQHPSRSKFLYEFVHGKPRRTAYVTETPAGFSRMHNWLYDNSDDDKNIEEVPKRDCQSQEAKGVRRPTPKLDPAWGKEYAYAGYYDEGPISAELEIELKKREEQEEFEERLQKINETFKRAIEKMDLR